MFFFNWKCWIIKVIFVIQLLKSKLFIIIGYILFVHQIYACACKWIGFSGILTYISWFQLMQLSMGTLNSPSSRIVKDLTPCRPESWGIYISGWWILTYFILGHGESSLNNVWSMVNLERTCILLFHYFLCLKANLDLEKTNQVGESSPKLYFRGVNLDPIILEKRWIDGESWPNNFVEKVNRGEDLRWVGSRFLWRVHKTIKNPISKAQNVLNLVSK